MYRALCSKRTIEHLARAPAREWPVRSNFQCLILTLLPEPEKGNGADLFNFFSLTIERRKMLRRCDFEFCGIRGCLNVRLNGVHSKKKSKRVQRDSKRPKFSTTNIQTPYWAMPVASVSDSHGALGRLSVGLSIGGSRLVSSLVALLGFGNGMLQSCRFEIRKRRSAGAHCRSALTLSLTKSVPSL